MYLFHIVGTAICSKDVIRIFIWCITSQLTHTKSTQPLTFRCSSIVVRLLICVVCQSWISVNTYLTIQRANTIIINITLVLFVFTQLLYVQYSYTKVTLCILSRFSVCLNTERS